MSKIGTSTEGMSERIAKIQQRIEAAKRSSEALLRRYAGLDLKIQVLQDEVQKLNAQNGVL